MKAIVPRMALMLAAASFIPLSAQAATYSNGTATATFLVSLTITSSCTVSANALAFGTTGLLNAATTGTSTLSVTCSNTTPYNIGLNAGSTTGSTATARLLAGTTTGNTTTTVSYRLMQDAALTTNWGTTQGSDTVAGTGTGSAQSVTIYGQVPTQTTPAPDSYQSTVTATVYF